MKDEDIVSIDGSIGRKFDSGKLRWDLLPYDAVSKIVEVLTYGAVKYEPNNWQKVTKERYEAALMRHFSAYMSGEKYDEESGLTHVQHAGCNILFLIWKEIQEGK